LLTEQTEHYPRKNCHDRNLIICISVVTKVVDAETETKTEAVYLKTEAEAQGSWPILLTVLSSGAVLAQKF